MTEKQYNFISSLIQERDYDYNNIELQAFRSGLDLTTSQASTLIGYLLSCDKLPKQSNELAAVKLAVKKIAKNRKTKKNDDIAKLVFQEIKYNLTKGNYYNLTDEQLKQIAHIVL